MVVGCLKVIITQSAFFPSEMATIMIQGIRKTVTQMRAKKLSHSIDEYCGHLHTRTTAEYSDVKRKHGMNLKNILR